MSALTKVYVVLLVVFSMLLTAGLVVYINREQNWKAEADKAKVELAASRLKADAALADAAVAKQLAEENKRMSQVEVAASRAKLTEADQKNADLRGQIAQQASDISVKEAEISRMTEAFKASADTQHAQQQVIADARKLTDDLTRKNSEAHMAISDLTNKLEITERERRWATEQLHESKNENVKLASILKTNHIDDRTPTPNKGLPATPGNVPIYGMVKAVRTIEGIPYATISVGSADSVSKGMLFQIIDRDKGDFLGTLTIETVEPNEAGGRLTGPKVTEVRPGVEARTQL